MRDQFPNSDIGLRQINQRGFLPYFFFGLVDEVDFFAGELLPLDAGLEIVEETPASFSLVA